MSRSFKRNPQMSAISELNITPLIDLAFSLLIIFMITTPLIEHSIPLDLPSQEASTSERQEDRRHEQISIIGPGEYYWQGQRMSREQFLPVLRELGGQISPPILHIRADRQLEYQEIVTLMDLLGQNNLTEISLDTAAGN